MVIFFPSIQPSLLSSCRNASTRTALPEAVLGSRITYAEDFPCLLRVTWINGRQKQDCKYEDKKFVSHRFSFTLASDARIASRRCDMPR